LHKREGYRAALPIRTPCARGALRPTDVARLMNDASIVRNRLKNRIDDRQRAGVSRGIARAHGWFRRLPRGLFSIPWGAAARAGRPRGAMGDVPAQDVPLRAPCPQI